MNFTRNIKLKVGNYLLSKKLKNFNRERHMHTLKTANTVGIIITPTDQESFEQIKRFLNYLTSKNIKVFILGYVNDKNIPNNFLFWKGMSFFSRKELKWTDIPESASVTDFIDQPFDMLIDLSITEYFPVKYVSTLSKASFKIGRFGRNGEECYDLMFEIHEDASLEEYIESLTHYLNLLSNPK